MAKPNSYFSPKLAARVNRTKGGQGVFACAPIEKGERLIVWGGRVVDRAELAQQPLETLHQSVQVDEDLFLITMGPPEPADYVNHSCDPNAGLRGQITLVALRAIAPGEEICFDYAMTDGCAYDEFDCACGSPLCRGRVSGADWRRPELQQRYAGYFSAYLQKRIEQVR